MASSRHKPLLRDLPPLIATPDLPGATSSSQKKSPAEPRDGERETPPAPKS